MGYALGPHNSHNCHTACAVGQQTIEAHPGLFSLNPLLRDVVHAPRHQLLLWNGVQLQRVAVCWCMLHCAEWCRAKSVTSTHEDLCIAPQLHWLDGNVCTFDKTPQALQQRRDQDQGMLTSGPHVVHRAPAVHNRQGCVTTTCHHQALTP